MSVTRKIWPQIASRVATARPMSVAAVTSPYPKVVRVVNEKYCRSGMLGSATCTNSCWFPRSAMAPYTAAEHHAEEKVRGEGAADRLERDLLMDQHATEHGDEGQQEHDDEPQLA